ncbi:MAG: citramalate synthase [Armatimonadetes bacterium]|nr:citramalate synthase [Armatimonadota bacterium]
MTDRVEIYDTTLRDGTQGAGVEFSAEDKLKCARALDELGVDYVEGGWPGSNPRDLEFFRLAKDVRWRHARLAAFGSTRRPSLTAEADPNLAALLEAGTQVVTIFGKSWDLHVRRALNTTLDENLKMIEESVRYLRRKDRRVLYDAEHFFDGFFADPEYAIATLQAAVSGGAECVILCDTNGGTLPQALAPVVRRLVEALPVRVGIHTHNDGECAVANTLAAVVEGATHVQGTINGYGERCGNANLCSILPNLALKMGRDVLTPGALAQLTRTSHLLSEIANLLPNEYQPFVGRNAFAHKGGIHVSAVLAAPQTYEHLAPERVGNTRRVVVSDLSGHANILAKAEELGLDLGRADPQTTRILERVKWLEYEGYQFEGAEASFELLARRAMGTIEPLFETGPFRVTVTQAEQGATTDATVRVRVGGVEEHTAADGNGPVHALDRALRKALERFYPEIAKIRLVDYKVRVINANAATGARVRVLIESTDGHDSWGTVGVSENVVEASWIALIDSLSYALWRARQRVASVLSQG